MQIEKRREADRKAEHDYSAYQTTKGIITAAKSSTLYLITLV